MPGRYRIVVRGRADQRFVAWLETLIGLLRAVPAPWRVKVELHKDDPPDEGVDSGAR